MPAHRFSRGGGVEVFTVGTRLTRVTRAMRLRDAERAIVAAGNRLNEGGGKLFIEGMSGAVQKVLEISGLIDGRAGAS